MQHEIEKELPFEVSQSDITMHESNMQMTQEGSAARLSDQLISRAKVP